MSLHTADAPTRTYGATDNNSALDDTGGNPPSEHREPGVGGGRVYFSQSLGRKSSSISRAFSRWKRVGHEEGGGDGGDAEVTSEQAPIPSALEHKGEPPTTPLPKLSMIVLSIAMLGEFLSANVPTPFILFMVKGFGEAKDEAEVAFWTGILVAAFFLTQFATSLLWATIAEKYGQRVVLFTSLLGSAVSVLLFGACSSLSGAITVRLLQGIFAGAVGVSRSSVIVLTDPSNEGRAYAILGFCWGLGGIVGPIIGGSFETPASKKWLGSFGQLSFFSSYPYILPCAIAASVTLTGSILSLFLARDGGPREGIVGLHPEKIENDDWVIPEEDTFNPSADIIEEQVPHAVIGSPKKAVSKRFSGYLSTLGGDLVDGTSQHAATPVAQPLSVPFTYTYSRNSRTEGVPFTHTYSRASRYTEGSARGYAGRPQSAVDRASLNFGERLLMANENAVTNIADLWVAAAISADNEDLFESGSEDDSDEELESNTEAEDVEGGPRSRPVSRLGRELHRPSAHDVLAARQGSRISSSSQSRPHSVVRGAAGTPSMRPRSSLYLERTPASRHGSIFSHSGVRPSLLFQDVRQTPRPNDSIDALAPIIEGHRLSDPELGIADVEPTPSLASQLPISVIVQYGLLGLHSTTHDQLFLSYLVSDYNNCGLNLNAGHFAQLVALMCFAQIIFQFYLYPPPRGSLSHLAMFRIGSLLFIPAYLTVTLYRPFASEEDDGNVFLMTALAISTAVRYCGSTFAYTSAAILLNYMTPPHAVGYANGVAQSIVSLARCFGPIIGGYLWAATTRDGRSEYYLGFVACAAIAAAAIAHSFTIR
ncbi:major facilitator superfamily MFS-1, partial [Athelia psychrophila]